MGIYTDLTSSTEIPSSGRIGLDRSCGEQLRAAAYQHDPDIGALYAARDEVAVIPEQTDASTADTYTLTVEFYGDLKGQSFTTGSIAYNAVATAIETAIDTAAAGLPGWSAGDISVSMAGAAGLDDGAVTLTFDGSSVSNTPAVVTLTPTGFTATGPITRTAGRPDRKALQALFELNVVSGTIHDAPDAPSDWVRPASNGQTRPRYQLIRDLAIIATQEDGTDEVYNKVKSLYPGI